MTAAAGTTEEATGRPRAVGDTVATTAVLLVGFGVAVLLTVLGSFGVLAGWGCADNPRCSYELFTFFWYWVMISPIVTFTAGAIWTISRLVIKRREGWWMATIVVLAMAAVWLLGDAGLTLSTG